MPFEFSASDDEKLLIANAISSLKESLAESANLAESLISLLNDNYLAIDKGYKRELADEYTRIGSALWQLNLVLHRMMQHKERIISKDEEII